MHTVHYDPPAGTHVEQAIREAQSLLMPSAKGQRAAVNFNGVNLFIGIADNPGKIARLYSAICKDRSESWRATEAGRKYEREQAANLAAMQENLTVCIKMLPGLLAIEDSDTPKGKTALILGWLNALVECSDHVGLDWDKAADLRGGGQEWICVLLESDGFRQGELCGLPQEEYEKPETLGRWIIGQAIDNLRHGLSPHPIARKFIQQYFELRRRNA